MVNSWLLFIYKVPNEPSARRVYVWRKLKAMGALVLQDSTWVLPANPRTREKLLWLAGEVNDMEDSQAMLWEGAPIITGTKVDLVSQFTDQADALYKDIFRQLEKKNPDLSGLARQFQQASLQDYFQSKLGQKVRQALLARRGDGKS